MNSTKLGKVVVENMPFQLRERVSSVVGNKNISCFFNPFTFDRHTAESKINKFSKVTGTNWVKLKKKQNHSKVMLNSFLMNGDTLETSAASVGN